MASRKLAVVAVVAAACLGPSRTSRGDERALCAKVTRTNLVQCALGTSLLVKGERQELEAAQAREVAVSPLLPTNPVLAVTVAKPTSASFDGYTWSATLSQEIEIAGQRGVRRDAADASVVAQSERVLLSRRDTAARAWAAFFEAVAAVEEERLADRFTVASDAVAVAARARAEKGLIADVDADVADARNMSAFQAKLAAERRVTISQATLASMLGFEPSKGSLSVEGDLVPVVSVTRAFVRDGEASLSERPEVRLLAAERRALERRADAFRRTRVSNPTVSLFAQNDEFNERALGVGISFPLPLPGNVGRTYVGEIAEAEALARRVATDRDRTEREIRLEVATFRQALTSRATEVAAFTPERVTRANTTLSVLGEEVEAGLLAVRDAVVAQQALIELLRANVEARRAWCLASVDFARAAGLPLEEGTP